MGIRRGQLVLFFIVFTILIITVCGRQSRNATGAAGRRRNRNITVSSFYRSCGENDHETCEFTIGRTTAFLVCNNKRKKCACKNEERIEDVSIWDIEWKPRTQECLFAAQGPCGIDNGLKIGCKNGLECIERRCRNPQKLRSNLEGHWCSDNIDCASGLQCEVTEFHYREIRSCVSTQNSISTNTPKSATKLRSLILNGVCGGKLADISVFVNYWCRRAKSSA